MRSPSSAYVSAVRAASEARHRAEAARIRHLRPRFCSQALPLLVHYSAFLVWTLAIPLVFLLLARSERLSASFSLPFRVVGWCALGSGLAYLLWSLWPI